MNATNAMTTAERASRLGLILTAAVTIGWASSAAALPLNGDQTSLNMTGLEALGNAGIDVSPVGTAKIVPDEVDRPTGVFEITGGEISGGGAGNATVLHEGSGLMLKLGGTELTISNFVITTINDVLSADVVGTGLILARLDIFDLERCGPQNCIDGDGSLLQDGFRLGLTDEFATLLNEIFKLDNFEAGDKFAVASIDLRPIPEPTTAFLMMLGLSGLAYQGRARSIGRR